MEQLPPDVERLVRDLESHDPAVRRAAAQALGQVSVSSAQIVTALKRVALAGGTPYDGSAQAAQAASLAQQEPVHQEMLE